MTQTDERRAQGEKRVPYETLVEVCSNDPGIPAFEASSIDVSGRGMHVRTAYLPDLGAPLVCRLEDQGREILVEGVVAWRNEQARGGEFGLKFTALDSGSVEALKALCRGDAETAAEESHDAAGAAANQPGSRVRLHIDGLGSPMKARVREARKSELCVGSNLEFLKVGKRLEIEDLEAVGRRIARIDSVTVTIDPQTQIPQLVVGLKYEGMEDADSTPEPSVIGAEPGSPPLPLSAAPSPRVEPEPSLAEDAELDGEPAMRGRLSELATSTGQNMARLSAAAAEGMSKVFQDASARVAEYRSRKKTGAVRRTAPAPSAAAEPRKLRPQTSRATDAVASARIPSKFMSKKVGVAGGAAVLAVTLAVFATRGSTPPPGADAKAVAEASASASDVRQVDAEGNPLPAALAAAPAGPKQPMTADVPLFGPTAMATSEPAPLGAPAEELEAAGLAPRAGAPAREAAVPDERWSDDAEEGGAPRAKTRPEDVKPWGHGKVKEPTVHRLRLDAPGGAIQGHTDPTGFTVLIPGRKLLENAGGIAKRDPRIARVKAQSTGAGAEITFRFKDGVPGYRVRLRRDFVEFLVSEADEAKRTAKPTTTGKNATAQKSAKSGSAKTSDKRR